jgi:hypothetical protein
MSAPPKKSDVQALLAHREPAINTVFLNAWGRWWRNPERSILYRRCRAGLVHNYMMLEAPIVFASDRGIHPVPGQETTYFVVDQKLVFRMKMGDEHGLSSNIGTQTSLAFVDPQGTLPCLPDVGRVDIVYVLNHLETLISRVLVVARDGDRVSWCYPIYPPAAAASSPVLAIQPRSPSPAGNVVRLPADRKKKESDNTKD